MVSNFIWPVNSDFSLLRLIQSPLHQAKWIQVNVCFQLFLNSISDSCAKRDIAFLLQENDEDETEKPFYDDEDDKSDEEKRMKPKKTQYIMDHDLHLLLKSAKPLLQSRNAAVSCSVFLTGIDLLNSVLAYCCDNFFEYKKALHCLTFYWYLFSIIVETC